MESCPARFEKQPITYPDRAEQILRTLSFSLTLQEDYVIVGSAHVSLSLQLDEGAQDTAIFGYLDDFDPLTGVTNYITEGSIRPSHRMTNDSLLPQDVQIGAFDTISRSFLEND